MTTLNICSRLSAPKTERFQVTVKDLDQHVKDVFDEINKHLKTEESFDIIYAGQALKNEDVLSKISVHNLSTLYVVRKFTQKKQKNSKDEATVSPPSKNEVTMAMQTALLNMGYRNIVQRMLSDPDSLENIIATTPGLDTDPTVLAMLQEPELAAVLSHPQNLECLLELHPSFAQAAVTIATAVNEEAAKSGRTTSGGFSYSMDQMSDEDEEMPEHPSRRPPAARGSGQSITASQLAAALQAAVGGAGMFDPAAAGASNNPSTSQQAGPSTSSAGITTDFFQQAMAHAQSASSEAALQQLRDMGITDENVARQALAATGGDIQAAIELIFSDGMM